MKKVLFIFISTLIFLITVSAQNTPEELGEKIFDLFKNESYSFKELIPTENQLIDKVESKVPELVQNRADDFRKEYPNLVKRFNQKCEEILEEGASKGINWPDVELRSIQPNKKTIGLKYEDRTITVEVTKLYVNFYYAKEEFSLVFDAVVEYNGQYLVSNDAIMLNKINSN